MLIMEEKIYTAEVEVRSFEKMHMKLKRPIEQYVFYLTGTMQDSEDVAQEVFIKLWINWSKLKTMGDDELKNYVFIMIRNHFINELRKNSSPKRNKRKLLIEYSKNHAGYYLHDEIVVTEGIKMHRQAVDHLTKKEKVVYLYHINDHSAEEIATMLNRSKCTINNQLTAAYKTVKTYLNKNYEWNLNESGRKNCWRPASLN